MIASLEKIKDIRKENIEEALSWISFFLELNKEDIIAINKDEEQIREQYNGKDDSDEYFRIMRDLYVIERLKSAIKILEFTNKEKSLLTKKLKYVCYILIINYGCKSF